MEDVAGTRVRSDSLMANHTLANWKDTVACLFSLLSARDWLRSIGVLARPLPLCMWQGAVCPGAGFRRTPQLLARGTGGEPVVIALVGGVACAW